MARQWPHCKLYSFTMEIWWWILGFENIRKYWYLGGGPIFFVHSSTHLQNLMKFSQVTTGPKISLEDVFKKGNQ